MCVFFFLKKGCVLLCLFLFLKSVWLVCFFEEGVFGVFFVEDSVFWFC